MVSLRKKGRQVLMLGCILLLAASASSLISFFHPEYSVELNAVAHSPSGFAGGYVIPASCPSYEHFPGECTPVYSQPYYEPYYEASYPGYSQASYPSYSQASYPGYSQASYPGYSQATYGGGYSQPSYGGGGYSQAGYGGGPTISCTPPVVRVGNTVVCTWQCGPGDASSSGIGFSTGGAPSGTSGPLVVTDSNSTFGVQCDPSHGQTVVNISVIHPVLQISASPTRIHSGSSATVTWSASGVTSCTITGHGINASGLTGSLATGALTTQSTYTLTCQSGAGPQTATATVFITPGVCEIGAPGCE